MVGSQKYHNRGRMEDWQVTLEGKTVKGSDLKLLPVEAVKVEEERVRQGTELEEMEESRQREVRCISNYFNIPSLAAFAQTLLTAAGVLRLDPQPILEQLSRANVKIAGGAQEGVEALPTTRRRMELCFSRRWRELQSILYLVLQEYTTPQGSLRTRVLVINQRGLILQTLSNVSAETTFVFALRVILTSYTRLQHLLVLSPRPNFVDLDSIGILRNALSEVNIMLVTYGERGRLEGVRGRAARRQAWLSGSGLRVAVYEELRVVVWYDQQINEQVLWGQLTALAAVLRCERRVACFFRDFQFTQHQFNQKQFLLRLFSFYFNFIAMGMRSGNEEAEKAAVMAECVEQLLEKARQVEARGDLSLVHSFTTMQTSLHCPVCRRRSRITCLKCCTDFDSKFAICELDCFETFHKDRIKYAAKVGARKKLCDLLIQVRDKDLKEAQEKDEELLQPAVPPVQSIIELREKWKGVLDGHQQNLDRFLRKTRLNFIPKKFVDRVNLLRAKISQLAVHSSSRPKPLKEQS